MRAPEDRLVAEGIHLLALVAKRIARRLGRRIPVEDLVALGHPALIDVARTYDPSRSTFEAYAKRKIRWAIFDGIRRETRWRSAAARASALAASARFAEGRGPDADADADAPATQEAYAARLSGLLAGHAAAMALGLASAHGDVAAVPDAADSPEECASRAQLAQVVRDAVSELPERERALVERHYFDGERFDQIAQDLGISKSWASRLHGQAIERLGERLRAAR
ncbi:sigma-70 family RNA polymerase sigma factor [Sorangium cellulosum]|uniref:RNA polymerase subunit sigma n=1 Tax=Sorangium cellulosum TaxID=56 RepID=A0A150QKD4_SORCE|nr:sigma-70 family RNA polymerase sigma factor [Sorangium cellulosum]KYF68292.1 RNA polymerase subunit sigma [Sorangium cellulosum]